MFRFVVRHSRWLARIPGAPQFLDAALLVWTALFHRERLAAIEAVEAAARTLSGVSLHPHRFGGTGFVAGETECAHLHGNGLLDCRFPLAQARELVRHRCAQPHHVFPRSGWVSFWIRSEQDVPDATALLQLALRALPAQRARPPQRGCSEAPRP